MVFKRHTTSLVVSLCLVVVVVNSKSTDYCSLCKDHIACGNDGQWNSTCSPDKQIVEMSSKLKDEILNFHNTKRNDLAMGELPGFETAVKIGVVTWEPELARLAEVNVKRCYYGHDKCRDTDKFILAGQNIAMSFLDEHYPDIKYINELMNGWFNEYKKADMNVVWPAYPMSALETSGHFTAIINQQNVKMGCAIGQFQTDKYDLYIVCNYAVTNLGGQPIYKPGPTASECTSGTDSKYTGLCSANEEYTTLADLVAQGAVIQRG